MPVAPPGAILIPPLGLVALVPFGLLGLHSVGIVALPLLDRLFLLVWIFVHLANRCNRFVTTFVVELWCKVMHFEGKFLTRQFRRCYFYSVW